MSPLFLSDLSSRILSLYEMYEFPLFLTNKIADILRHGHQGTFLVFAFFVITEKVEFHLFLVYCALAHLDSRWYEKWEDQFMVFKETHIDNSPNLLGHPVYQVFD